mmetsp:Transcript_25180/g.72704  ORF Transcript_25180/g.72704 Transcript_25180/m.72704 type:complete len:92 (+) Transcript_25180:849-1124(+)
MSLSLCFHVCVGVFVCVCAAIYSRDVEVNDLRISREKCIISVKTARRFPGHTHTHTDNHTTHTISSDASHSIHPSVHLYISGHRPVGSDER